MPSTAALEMPPPVSIFAKSTKATRKNKPPPSSAYNVALTTKAVSVNKTLKNKATNKKNNSARNVAQELVIAWMEAEKEEAGSEKAYVLLQQIWNTPAALEILRSLA